MAMAMTTKWAMARTRAMVRVGRVMAMAMRVVGNKEAKVSRQLQL